MRHSNLRTILVVSALCVLGAAAAASAADEEQLASYCDLTVAHLVLVRDTLQQGRMLTAAEEHGFFGGRGTTPEAYYAFAGENRQELEDYLAANPETSDQIEALRQEIEALIAAAETAAAEGQ